MKNILWFLSIVFITISCQAQEQKEQGGDINVEEAQKLIEKGGITILDVRTPEEVAKVAIEGSLNIDLRADSFKEDIAKLDKDKTYLVYCHAGGRSARAMKIMKKMGFSKVYNMEGGISKWEEAKSAE